MKPRSYHAHLYFEADQLEPAQQVLESVRREFGFPIGKVWDRPVGPHPMGSCQITVPEGRLEEFVNFMMEAREDFSVFIHANTGNDLADHTQHVLWLGKSFSLDTSLFR